MLYSIQKAIGEIERPEGPKCISREESSKFELGKVNFVNIFNLVV